MKLLVASRNTKKLAEVQRVLASADLASIEVVGLDTVEEFPETPETGATFAENSLIKARDGAVHSGWVTVADDSGLTVDALNGMPGVLSARWCGEHSRDQDNLELVLAQLRDVSEERRGAAFVSAVAIVVPESFANSTELAERGLAPEMVVEGEWRGVLTSAPRGDNGFGYDPIFQPWDADGRTSAELSALEKDTRSHRGQALRAAVPLLRALAQLEVDSAAVSREAERC